MDKNILIIYNTCEFKNPNLFYYIDAIESLLDQDYKNFHIAISGCKLTSSTKLGLQANFKSKVSYCFMDDIQPVNITFNKAVYEIIKYKGEYDGYIYVDSGVNVKDNRYCLSEINKRAQTNKFGIITLQTDTDTGYENWFGVSPDFHFTEKDFIVPIGRCCNLHFNYFDNKLFNFFGRIIPDIFKAYCTESVFSFLPASLGLQWVIIKDIILSHEKSIDGATVGFDHLGEKGYWNNLMFGLDILDILNDPKAIEVGFGYEEWQGILFHNPDLFTNEGIAKNEDLKYFLKEKLFLSNKLFDYNDYKCKTII